MTTPRFLYMFSSWVIIIQLTLHGAPRRCLELASTCKELNLFSELLSFLELQGSSRLIRSSILCIAAPTLRFEIFLTASIVRDWPQMPEIMSRTKSLASSPPYTGWDRFPTIVLLKVILSRSNPSRDSEMNLYTYSGESLSTSTRRSLVNHGLTRLLIIWTIHRSWTCVIRVFQTTLEFNAYIIEDRYKWTDSTVTGTGNGWYVGYNQLFNLALKSCEHSLRLSYTE